MDRETDEAQVRIYGQMWRGVACDEVGVTFYNNNRYLTLFIHFLSYIRPSGSEKKAGSEITITTA